MPKHFNDDFADQSLTKLEEHIKWNGLKKMEVKNRVLTNIEKIESQKQMRNKPNLFSRYKRMGSISKISSICMGFMIFIGLLIGSAFVSPAMANVMGNIPYLGTVFQSKSILKLINDELDEKGYTTASAGVSYYPKKMIDVAVEGSDEYYHEVKGDIEKSIKGVLKEKGYDAYSVNVHQFEPKSEDVLNEEELKEKNLLEDAVTMELKQEGYQFDRVQADPTEKTIFINIVGPDEYYESINEDVERVAIDVANINNYSGYSSIATRVRVEVTKQDERSLIISAITEGLLSKKEFKVTGVSHKYDPFHITIMTSILSSDPAAKMLGARIESMIIDLLKTEDISAILKDEPYDIIVQSKDHEKIN
ncbi:DUF4030 domain-containing protein [Bacillus sp. 2205SS5-2]|uniref:DUF4030 domain-containing protein n=1 Tax=Bacillus sp. 2205SS5-2 TaxID=3109031 RepID=UPI003006232D